MPRVDAVDRRILKLAFPALGSLAIEPLYVLTDTAIVGRLGTQELAGLAIAASVLAILFAAANFLTYGTTERVARRLGSGDVEGAANVGVQTMWLSLLIGVVAAPLLAVFARPVVAAFGASGAVADHATTYLSLSALGVPFILLTLGAQGVLRGASRYQTPLWILLAANVANAVIEIVLVFHFDLGIAGSAWSTVVSQAGAAIAFVLMLRPALAGATVRRPTRAGMAPLMSAGRHLLLRVGSMLVVLSGSTALAARIDEPTLAAHQIVVSLFYFLALTLDALAIPAQTIVAEELGRGDERAAAHVAHRSARLSIVTGLLLGAALAITAPIVPHAFTGDAEVLSRATAGAWWLAAVLVPGAIAFAYDGVLIGAGDYRFLGRAAFVYTVIVAPIGVVVMLFPSLGIAGIWAGLLLWMLLRARINRSRVASLLPI